MFDGGYSPGLRGWFGSVTGWDNKPAREKGGSRSSSEEEKRKHARMEVNDCILILGEDKEKGKVSLCVREKKRKRKK